MGSPKDAHPGFGRKNQNPSQSGRTKKLRKEIATTESRGHCYCAASERYTAVINWQDTNKPAAIVLLQLELELGTEIDETGPNERGVLGGAPKGGLVGWLVAAGEVRRRLANMVRISEGMGLPWGGWTW